MGAASRLVLIAIGLSVCDSRGWVHQPTRTYQYAPELTLTSIEKAGIQQVSQLVSNPADDGRVTAQYLLVLLLKLTREYENLEQNFKIQANLVDSLRKYEMQSKGLNRIKSQQIKEMQEALQQCSKNQETKPIQDASLNSVKIQEQNPVQEVNLNNCKNQEQNPVQEVNLNNCRTELNQTAAMITSLRSQYETCEKLVENLKREQLEKSSTTEAPQPLQNNAVLNQKEQINLRTCTQFENSTGVQSVKVPTMGDVSVFCDSQIAGSGWLVIQRRLDGKTDFNRNWTDYRDGFGNLTGEFFIGLETLNQITKSEQHELFIQLEDFEGEKRFARYDRFEVGDENSSYRLLSLGEYSGNAGDALTSNLLAKFSTNDQDTQDRCASLSDGAWWYGSRCGFSNLNGVYSDADTIYDYDGTGIYWSSGDWHDTSYSLKTVHMMIRPKAP